MVITQFYREREDGVNLYRTYSDANVMILQDGGAVYSEAIDVEGSTHTYTETDIPVEADNDDLLHAARILFGEEEP